MFPVIVTPGLSRAEILLSYSKLYNAQTRQRKAQSLYFRALLLAILLAAFILKVISVTFRSQRKAKNNYPLIPLIN